MKEKFRKILLSGIQQIKNPYYEGFAASLAFYIILSIVPILMLLSQLLGVFGLSLASLQEVFSLYLTEEMAIFVHKILSFTPSSASNFIFILMILWSSSKAQFSLVRIGSYTMSGGESTGNGFIRDRIWALLSTILVVISFAAGLILLVYGEWIFRLILTLLDQLLLLPLEDTMGSLWLVLRWPIAFGIYFLVVWINYSLMSNKRISFKKVAPGALFASVGILLVTFLYSLYTNLIAKYDLVYGALASIVALMMWVYFIAWCLGVGLIVNRAFLDAKDPQ
jgi:membrane protein